MLLLNPEPSGSSPPRKQHVLRAALILVSGAIFDRAGAPSSLDGPSRLPSGGSAADLDHLECRQCGTDLFDFAAPLHKKRPGGMLRPGGALKPMGIISHMKKNEPAAEGETEPVVGGRTVDLDAMPSDTGPADPDAEGYSGPHRPASTKQILGKRVKIHHLKNPHVRAVAVPCTPCMLSV